MVARRRLNQALFPFHSVDTVDQRVEGRWEAAVRRRARKLMPFPSKFQAGIAQCADAQGWGAVHAHFGWHGSESLLAARRVGLPVITSFYGRDVYSPGFGRQSASSMFRELFTVGSRFTCVGPRALDELIRQGCPEERLSVVKLAIDLDTFPYRRRQPSRPLVILQIARFTEKKGVDLTLRAFAEARDRLGSSELWLIGDGVLRDSLVGLASELRLGDQVKFLGALSQVEVQDHLSRAHIGIQPSRTATDGDREGSPTVLLEMQAAGLPVVATDHADIPSIVARPGDLVAENDVPALAHALVRLASLTGAEISERTEEGRALVEREHDRNRIGEQLSELYNEVAAPGRAGP